MTKYHPEIGAYTIQYTSINALQLILGLVFTTISVGFFYTFIKSLSELPNGIILAIIILIFALAFFIFGYIFLTQGFQRVLFIARKNTLSFILLPPIPAFWANAEIKFSMIQKISIHCSRRNYQGGGGGGTYELRIQTNVGEHKFGFLSSRKHTYEAGQQLARIYKTSLVESIVLGISPLG